MYDFETKKELCGQDILDMEGITKDQYMGSVKAYILETMIGSNETYEELSDDEKAGIDYTLSIVSGEEGMFIDGNGN